MGLLSKRHHCWTHIVPVLGERNVGRCLYLSLLPSRIQWRAAQVCSSSGSCYQHLWSVKLQISCNVHCACQYIYLFIPSGTGVARPVHLNSWWAVYGRMAVRAAHSRLYLLSQVRWVCIIMAWVVFGPLWETSCWTNCETSSTSMVRLDVCTE